MALVNAAAGGGLSTRLRATTIRLAVVAPTPAGRALLDADMLLAVLAGYAASSDPDATAADESTTNPALALFADHVAGLVNAD